MSYSNHSVFVCMCLCVRMYTVNLSVIVITLCMPVCVRMYTVIVIHYSIRVCVLELIYHFKTGLETKCTWFQVSQLVLSPVGQKCLCVHYELLLLLLFEQNNSLL